MSLNASEIAALLAQPALKPPDGVTPEFDNPPNRNGLALFVTTFCAIVATLFVLLRIIGKWRLGQGFRLEETLMVLGYGAFWGTNYAAYQLMKAPGFYVHTWNLHNGDLVYPLHLILIYGCCYSAVLPLVKTAILIDWCAIFVPSDRSRSLFWWASVILALVQCLWGLACIVLLNMQCRPHQAIWEFYLPSQCYSLPSVMLASASTQVATDFFMILLPQHIIWKLNLNWQRQVGVSVIFGVGALGFISSCLRLEKTIVFARSTDTMYLIGPLLFWADGEMTCAFFILSVTCLPKLLSQSPISRRVKRILGLPSSGSSGSTGKNSNSHVLNHSRSATKGGGAIAIHGTTGNPYYNLDREGTNHASSESQENLRREYEISSGNDMDARGAFGRKGLVVTHTTHIDVSERETQSKSGSATDSDGTMRNRL